MQPLHSQHSNRLNYPIRYVQAGQAYDAQAAGPKRNCQPILVTLKYGHSGIRYSYIRLEEGTTKIVLAVDGSVFSEAATQFVLRQARPEDTEVRVLRVMEPTSIRTDSGEEGYYAAVEASFEEATKRSEALVAKTAELLRSKGFKVTSSASAD